MIIITITLSSSSAAAATAAAVTVLQAIKACSFFMVMITASFPWPTYVSSAGQNSCIH
jgi:hypothetical protein